MKELHILLRMFDWKGIYLLVTPINEFFQSTTFRIYVTDAKGCLLTCHILPPKILGSNVTPENDLIYEHKDP